MKFQISKQKKKKKKKCVAFYWKWSALLLQAHKSKGMVKFHCKLQAEHKKKETKEFLYKASSGSGQLKNRCFSCNEILWLDFFLIKIGKMNENTY